MRFLLAILLSVPLYAWGQPAAPDVVTYGTPWLVPMQPTEKFPVALDYKNYLAPDESIASVASITVKVLSKATPGVTPMPTQIAGFASAIPNGKWLVFTLDARKAVNGTDYQVTSVVTGSEGSIVSWPIRVNVRATSYSPH